MRYFKLTIAEKEYTNDREIDNILLEDGFGWIVDAEIKNAIIEIKNNTIIWKSGKWFYGDWKYGIFKGGEFYGVFKNGIIDGGQIKGEFEAGINLVE